MNSQKPVVNISGDNPETLIHLAAKLGRSQVRRAIFNVIYGKGERPRSRKQISEILGRQDQSIQNELEYLARHHLIARTANDGFVKDASKWVYGKDDTVRAHRKEIIRYADNPASAKKVATKRTRTPGPPLSMVKSVAGRKRGKRVSASHSTAKLKLKIALLVTNPDMRASLQTGIEARDIDTAIRLAGRAHEVDLKMFTAPTLDVLMDMLNSYRPDVVHFSGHGGGGTLVFDNERAGQDGGTILDFDMVARVLEATSASPRLMVLAACDTAEGADRFLDAVPAVIAMSDSVGDEAACAFSKRFYQSLTAGETIANSLQQAKILLEHQGYRDADLPTLIARTDEIAQGRLI